ncbi:MAG: hypothetical protein AAB114_00605, partial [Chloroflexota bacterium]
PRDGVIAADADTPRRERQVAPLLKAALDEIRLDALDLQLESLFDVVLQRIRGGADGAALIGWELCDRPKDRGQKSVPPKPTDATSLQRTQVAVAPYLGQCLVSHLLESLQ